MKRYLCLFVFLAFSPVLAFSEASYNFLSGWQLFTLPYYTESAKTPCKLIDNPDFVLYGIKGNQYVACDALDSALPGQAFWVHLPETEIVFTGTPVDTTRPYPIALEQGWNLIGNPFLTAIDIGEARVDGVPLAQAEGVAKVAYGYDTAGEGYAPATKLEPWKGYFIFARREALLELSASAGEGEEPPSGPTVVTIRIEDAPGGAGSEVGAIDLMPGGGVSLWAAGYDSEGNFLGNVGVLWQADGNLGSLDTAPAQSLTYNSDAGGKVGALYASYGTLRDSTGRVVVIDDSETAVYPHTADDPVATDDNDNEYVSDQLIVSVQPGTTPEQVEELAAEIGAIVAGRNEAAGLYQLKLTSLTPAEAAAALADSPEVAETSPNYLLRLDAVPNDTVFGPTAPASQRWAFEKIQMPLVWNEYTPVADPVIAVLDTGVDASHPELAGRVLAGKNFVSPATPDDTDDAYGHGTPIAGIAAAAGDNAEGIAGMCWNCRVLPVKVCTDTGACPLFSLLNGIIYAVDSGARVLNVSIGADFPPGSGVEPIIRAVTKEAYNNGAFLVGSAGNGNHDSATYLPASDRYVLSVGATDEADRRASFSNYGVRVAVAAPGTAIYTTESGGGYTTVSGTSESAAFVSGLAGMILSIRNNLTPSTLESFITSNVDVITTDQPIGGRINAYKALRLLASLNQPPSIVSVTPDTWIVVANSSINIEAVATDPDGEPVTLAWTASGGALAANTGSVVSWTAPASRGTVDIEVTASDPIGNNSTAKIQIAVLDTAPVELRIDPQSPTLAQGDTLAFTAYAYDAAALGGTAPPVPVINATWALTGGIGSISADGVLAAINAGTGTLTAEADSLTATTQVKVNPSTSPTLNPAAFICGNDWLAEGCDLPRTSRSSLDFNDKFLTYKCRYQTDGQLLNLPITDGDYIYLADASASGFVYKLLQEDCSEVWKVTPGAGPFQASPVLVDNTVWVFGKRIYVASGSDPANVVSMDTNGVVVDTYTTDANQTIYQCAPVAYASGTVNYIYVQTRDTAVIDGQMIGLRDDGVNLTEIWKHRFSDFGVNYGGPMNSSPVLETVNGVDTVFFSTSFWNTLVTAKRADNGLPVWTNASNPAVPPTGTFFATDSSGLFTTPVIGNGQYLYVVGQEDASGNGHLYKLDAGDGTFIWAYEFSDAVGGSPAYEPGAPPVLYVGTYEPRMYAIQDDGLSASLKWSSADLYGTPGQTYFTHLQKPVIFDTYLLTTSYWGGGEHIKILNRSDGTTFQSFPEMYTLRAGLIMGFESVISGKAEAYFNSAQFHVMLQENTPPVVDNVFLTPNSVSPGDMFAVSADVLDADSSPTLGCEDSAQNNDIYKYPTPYTPSFYEGKYAVHFDHSAVSGASATDTFLFDDFLAPLAPPCTHENDGDDDTRRDIAVALGTPSGDYCLCVTAMDKAGETNDTTVPPPPCAANAACAQLTIEDATPTIKSITYNPGYVHNTDAATTSVSVEISYPNADINNLDLTIDLSVLGSGAGYGIVDFANPADCTAFVCGAECLSTCTYDQVKAATDTAPGNYNPLLEVCNPSPTCNTATATVPLEVITIDYFEVTADPTTQQVPLSVDVGIRAYDKYNNFMATFENLTKIDLAQLGAASGTTLTWGGAGVTDFGDGTGEMATSTMTAGVATATLANTMAEGPITASASIYFWGSWRVGDTTTTGTDITWLPGALGQFMVTAQDTAPLAGDAVDVIIDAYDAYDNFISTYVNANQIDLTNIIVATGLPSAFATWTPATGIVAPGSMVNGTVTIQIGNTVAEGPLRVIATDAVTPATGDTGGTVSGVNTDITWSLGVIDHFRVEAAPNVDLAAGASSTVTVTAEDAVNNTVTNYDLDTDITHSLIVPGGLSTTLSYSGTGVTDNGDGTALIQAGAFTLGVATFSVTNITAGEQARFTATKQGGTETGNTGTTGTDVNWIPGSLDKFEVTAQSTSATVGGTPVDIIIRALDQYDNFIDTYTNAANVTLSNAYSPPPGAGSPTVSWGGTSVVGSDITPGGFAAGTCTVTIDNTVAEGPITAIATDGGGKTGNTNETGTDITWDYGPVNYFDVVAAPFTDLLAGDSSTITVTAFDIFSNPILTFDENVAITHEQLVPGGASSTALTYTGLSGTTLPGSSFSNASATFAVSNTTAGETVEFIATYLAATGSTSVSGTNVNWIPDDLATLEIQKGLACSDGGTVVATEIISVADTIDMCAAGFDQYNNFIGPVSSEWCVDNLTAMPGCGWCSVLPGSTLDSIPAGPSTTNTFGPTTKSTSGYICARDAATLAVTDDAGKITVSGDTPMPPVLSATGGDLQVLLGWATPTLYTDGLPISQAVQDALTYNIWASTSPGIDCAAAPSSYSAGPGTTTYTDSAVTPWTTYYYRVIAVNNSVAPAEESECSNEASATPMEPGWVLIAVCGDSSGGYLPPSDLSRFNRPMDAVIDSDGYVYVADTDNHRVKKMTLGCTYMGHWGQLGANNGEFKEPSGIALYNDELFVVDNYSRVQVFDKNGNYKRNWAVQYPIDIEVDSGGTVYVSTEMDSVMKYDTDGVYLGKIDVIYVRGIGVDDTYLYAASAADDDVKLIDPGSGAVVGAIGSSGSAYGQFIYPYDVDVNASGTIFVADGYTNNRIQMMDSGGTMENVIPGSCDADAEERNMYKPFGVGLAPTGELAVMDTYNSRVLIFSPPPP